MTKPKTLFMNLLAQFMYLIEIEVSYSLLETILAKINNAPQEEVKNVFFNLIGWISFVLSLLT